MSRLLLSAMRLLPAFTAIVAATVFPCASYARDRSAFDEVAAREQSGFVNHTADRELQFLESRYPSPKDQLEIDSRVLVGSFKSIVRRAQEIPTIVRIQSSFGRSLPVGLMIVFRDSLARVFRLRLGMGDAAAETLANALEMQVLAAAGVDAAEYRRSVGRAADERNTAHLVLRELISAQATAVPILTRCDIPFVAGYSTDARVVYIDRSVPAEKLFKGVRVPVAQLLNLHERVEKAVLDEFGSSYPHAHQIALRVEKLAADAIGAPWPAYNAYWTVVANAMESKPIKQVPRDLDMTPYLTFRDADSKRTVESMRRAFVDPQGCRPD